MLGLPWWWPHLQGSGFKKYLSASVPVHFPGRNRLFHLSDLLLENTFIAPSSSPFSSVPSSSAPSWTRQVFPFAVIIPHLWVASLLLQTSGLLGFFWSGQVLILISSAFSEGCLAFLLNSASNVNYSFLKMLSVLSHFSLPTLSRTIFVNSFTLLLLCL